MGVEKTMLKKKKKIIINIPNYKSYPLVGIDKILDLQGKFKKISGENFNKLKNEIINNGFCFPIFCWEGNSKIFSLDGKHRIDALLSLKNDGYLIPEEIPYIKIYARNKKEAVKKILALNSQYAEITKRGIDDLLITYEIDPAEMGNFKFKGIEFNIDFESIDIDSGNLLDGNGGKTKEIFKCVKCGFINEI
jgi:hypothetical protein